jgi:hypothetical protein
VIKSFKSFFLDLKKNVCLKKNQLTTFEQLLQRNVKHQSKNYHNTANICIKKFRLIYGILEILVINCLIKLLSARQQNMLLQISQLL